MLSGRRYQAVVGFRKRRARLVHVLLLVVHVQVVVLVEGHGRRGLADLLPVLTLHDEEVRLQDLRAS